MDAETLHTLLIEVEAEDPIDYADLPFDEHNLRTLACQGVAEQFAADAFVHLAAAQREQVLLAALARLVLENMVLHARILRAAGGSPATIPLT